PRRGWRAAGGARRRFPAAVVRTFLLALHAFLSPLIERMLANIDLNRLRDQVTDRLSAADPLADRGGRNVTGWSGEQPDLAAHLRRQRGQQRGDRKSGPGEHGKLALSQHLPPAVPGPDLEHRIGAGDKEQLPGRADLAPILPDRRQRV